MSTSRSLSRSLFVFALAAFVTLAVGCGGDSDTSFLIASNAGTGTVVVVVTDAPSEEFEQIWLTVTEVELIGAGGHFTLFEGRRVFDLLSLRDDARLLAVGREVPAGDWSKLRLHVEDVELIRIVDEDQVVGTEIDCPDEASPGPGFVCESITPKLGGNGKLDLNPRGPVAVRAGERVFVQLDLDAFKSVHIHPAGRDRFQFRPVVFIDAFTLSAPPRLVRLEGRIQEIDPGAQQLLLCGTHRVFRAAAREESDARSRCVDVRAGPETSIFDEDGEPAELADLAVGDEAAVLGRFRAGPGETLAFDALWIHQGGFDAGVTVAGEVIENVVGDEFAIAPTGTIDADELIVRLVPGARLFTRAGAPLSPADLEPGLHVRAFGVLALSSSKTDRLDASLVFARTDANHARLRGTVAVPFDAADGTLVLQATTNTSVGPVCVAVDASDPVFRIVDQGELLRSERSEASALAVGEVVTAFGAPGSPCFDARALVSYGVGG